MKKIFTLLLTMLGSSALFAQVIYVDSRATTGVNNGTSWANAYTRLQDALAAATSGQQVWVAAGTYYPDEGGGKTNNDRQASFVLKNGVALYGGFAGNEADLGQRNWNSPLTILSGDIDGDNTLANNTATMVKSTGLNRTAILDGFTITGATDGGMLNDRSSPTITHCTFTGNTTPYVGGGMINFESSPAIDRCIFSANTANYTGGAMHNFENFGSTIQCAPVITNCLFIKNTANGRGGAIFNERAHPRIFNCTFWGNSAAAGGGLYYYESTYIHIPVTNCILWGDIGGEIQTTDFLYPDVRSSIVQGGYSGGNLNQNPQFVDPEGGDLRLQCSSPAIDAGNNAEVATTTDLDGRPRIIHNQVDMGAYEYALAAGILYVQPGATGRQDGSSWADAFTSLQDALAQAPICNKPTQVWVARGTFYPDEGGGLSDNDPSASFHLKNNITIYGGFAGTETSLSQRNLSQNTTVLSGDVDRDGTLAGNAYHVVTAVSVDYTATLSDVTITGGRANGPADRDRQGGGLYMNAAGARLYYCSFDANEATYGGAVYAASSLPTFAWCDFRGNKASRGGAIYNAALSQLTVLGSSFSGNEATGGGALYNEPRTVLHITNGRFFHNTATGPGAGPYKGGALYNAGANTDLVNCSFSANTAPAGYGGALYNEASSPTLTNTILWGNSSEIDNDAASSPAVTYSLVQGGPTDNHNLNVDPQFVNAATGDLHLQPCSPAIDAGNNSAAAGYEDLDHHARIRNYIIDLGVYEAQENRCCPSGGVLFVNGAATGKNNGTTWADAFTSLQDALAHTSTCTSVTQIWVAAGTYYPDEGAGMTNNSREASFNLKAGVALYGGFAGTEVVLEQRDWKTNVTTLSGDVDGDGTLAGNAYHVVQSTNNNSTAPLDGFTITGGNADGPYQAKQDRGAGLYNQASSPTLANCSFTGNTAGRFGGGLYNDNSSPAITNCTFSGNTAVAYQGGAIYNYSSSPGITFCSFSNNTAGGDGGGIYNDNGSSATISNCSFTGNTGSNGGAIGNFTSTPAIRNCTFMQNEATNLGGALYNYAASPTIYNCSFYGNTAGAGNGGAIHNTSVSTPVITNCILWDNTPYQLVNWGTHSIPVVSYSIVQGGYPGGSNIINADPLFVNAAAGNLHVAGCSPAINAGTASGAPSEDLDGAPRPSQGGYDMGAYEFQGALYVKKDATGLNDGSSWANAFTSLQDALAQSTGCSNLRMIWVARGTYYPDEGAGQTNNDRSASFHLKNNLAILGGFAGTETSLSQRFPASARNYETVLSGEIDGVTGNAGNAYHVVRSEGVDSSAVLDGFTITAGNANGSTDNGGGGLYNTSTPTIRYCLFNANSATNGGALYNTAAASIINCRFTQNKATYGGAVYNSVASPSIPNGWFWKNSATSQGGAIYNTAASPQIINGSFNSNTATSSYGGALRNVAASAPVVTNSILWGDGGGEISNDGSTPVVSYSIVQGGYSGESNLDADPLFKDPAVGNLSLKNYPISSPAIDAGNNAAVTLTTDVYGDQRIYNGIVDRGADEYYPGGIGGPEPLVLTCPQDFTLQTDPGSCGVVADYSGAHAATTTGGEPPITITYDPAPGTLLPLGDVWVTVTAKDALTTRHCHFWITVVDSTAPQITGVLATPFVLYPPNHKFQEVKVKYTARDNCEIVSTGLSVSSNEAPNAIGSGNTSGDGQVLNDSTVLLRAERSGKGTDRVYTITITARDAAGNESQATTTVTVLHDKGAPVTAAEAAGTKEVSRLQVSAVPNPSSAGFTLTAQSPSDLPLGIKVMDAAGRVIEQKEGVAPNGTFYLGSTYRPGVYYLQVAQGNAIQSIRLVKQTR